MKNRTKFLNLGISILACLILFICLGLSVIGPGPISAFSDSQFDFFVFLSRYGISLAFFLTVLALILLYKHQKMLVKDQEDIARVLSTRSPDSGLDETASMYYRIFNFAPIGVIKSTRNGKVVFCNPMCAWIFGFGGTDEFVEKINSSEQGIRQLYVDPKDREEFFRILDQDRCSWHQIQKQFYRKDGSIFYASVRGSLRQEIDRQEECFFGFIEDISSRIDAEKTLRKSEKNYRDLIEKATSIVIQVNSVGEMTYANEFAQKFFGYTKDDLIGKHVIRTICDPEIFNEGDVNRVLQDICDHPGEFRVNENMNRCRDGRQVWIVWSNKAIVKDDGSSNEILSIGTDITEQKQLQESLQHQVMIERFLQDISTSVVNTPWDRVEEVINASLDKIRSFFEADGAYICFFNEDGFVRESYFRSHQDVEACKEFVDRFFLSDTEWWLEEFGREPFVLFENIGAIPLQLDVSRQIFLEFGLKKVVAVPLFFHDRFIGFIGLNALKDVAPWVKRQMAMLRICGEIFVSALERRKTQHEIVEARDRTDTAIRGGYLGMYDLDIPSGNVLFNDIWFRMLGYSPREMPHTFETWKTLIHPKDKDRVLKVLDEYLHGAQPFYSQEYRLATKDGNWKWIHAQGHIAKRAEDGAPLRMVGLHRDITELKSAENQLKHQRDIFSSLIENMPEGIFAKDVKNEFRFIVWNKKMESMFGLSRHDVLGKTDYDLFDKGFADHYLMDDMEVMKKKIIKEILSERIQTAGGERWAHTIKVPIFDENGDAHMLFGILEDITEKHQMEVQLRHTQKMQAVGQLAAGVAHEVKNPLAIILLAAEGLGMNQETLNNEKLQNKVRAIKDSAIKANNVITELLRFSRLSDSDMEYVNLHKVIDDAYFLSQNRSKEKQVEFVKEYCDQEVGCYGNAVLMEQVFVNLFNNAVDAIEQAGKVTVRTRILKEKDIIVEVEDTGSGIPENIRSKVFDPFYTTKDTGNGTGLGLSTVFMIIEKHNGAVRIDPSYKNGARFVISLPFSDKNSLDKENVR